MPRFALVLAIALAACSRSSAPASASAPAPAPSLACRSLATRTAEAQLLYGDDVHLATVDDTFLFIDPNHTPLFAESLRFAPRVLSALRHERIAARPLCPVRVYIFSSRDDFNHHCATRHYLPESGRNLGVYDRIRGEIVTDVSDGPNHVFTQAHELAHLLMDADWQAPLWFRECIGSLYESPSLPDDAHAVIHGIDDWRYPPLRDAVRAHDPAAHFGALFGMSHADFRGKSDAGGTDGTRSTLTARWRARPASGSTC
jgi:hypothetical protein